MSDFIQNKLKELSVFNEEHQEWYVPFDKMKEYDGWANWSNGITSYTFGYYLNDVANFLRGVFHND